MVVKEGFFLIELIISFTLLIFLLFLASHYIIEIKNIQQESLAKAYALSVARNITETVIAGVTTMVSSHKLKNNVITVTDDVISVGNSYSKDNRQTMHIKKIKVKQQINKKEIVALLLAYTHSTTDHSNET
jgi:hypothetical protein